MCGQSRREKATIFCWRCGRGLVVKWKVDERGLPQGVEDCKFALDWYTG